MTQSFISKQHPTMNFFLQRLFEVLETLPDEKRPKQKGFCIAYFNPKKRLLTAEFIGMIDEEKEFKFLHLACKKATQVLCKDAILSREFEDKKLEQYPGGFSMCTPQGIFSAGVSGYDGMLDEAICILWLIAKKLVSGKRLGEVNLTNEASDELFQKIRAEAYLKNELAPDNQWIKILAERMLS